MSDMGATQTPVDSLRQSQLMEQGGGGGVRTSAGTGGSKGGSMLPFEGKGLDENFGTAAQGITTLQVEGVDSIFSEINQNAAFEQSISASLGQMANHLGTEEAKGQEVGDFTAGDKFSPPTLQGDAQMKKVGIFGKDQGNAMG
jgi:hypothetical protein